MPSPIDDWRELAACNAPGVFTEWFFPVAEMSGRVVEEWRYAQARPVCARCPVATECLVFAIRKGITFGMFGGKTPAERRKIGGLCINGHAMTPDNVLVLGGERRCRACKHEAQSRYREGLRIMSAAMPDVSRQRPA